MSLTCKQALNHSVSTSFVGVNNIVHILVSMMPTKPVVYLSNTEYLIFATKASGLMLHVPVDHGHRDRGLLLHVTGKLKAECRQVRTTPTRTIKTCWKRSLVPCNPSGPCCLLIKYQDIACAWLAMATTAIDVSCLISELSRAALIISSSGTTSMQ